MSKWGEREKWEEEKMNGYGYAVNGLRFQKKEEVERRRCFIL